MPLTGNQANSARVFRDDVDLNDDPLTLNQLIWAINGHYGLPFKLIAYGSASIPVLHVRNTNAAGHAIVVTDDAADDVFVVNKTLTYVVPAFQVYSASGRLLLDVQATGITLGAASDETADVRIGETTGTVSIGTVDADATEVLIGGDNSYVGIASDSIDLVSDTTSGYFHINGGTPYTTTNKAIEKINYTGDGTGAAGGRQIPCGFAANYAIVTTNNVADADVAQYNVYSTIGSTRLTNAGNINGTSGVKLHGSDGIIVGAGGDFANVSGRNYTFIAFR